MYNKYIFINNNRRKKANSESIVAEENAKATKASAQTRKYAK